MTTSSSVRDEVAAFLKKFHDAGDSLNAQRMPDVYSRNAVLQFANRQPLIGVESIVKFFEEHFQVIAYMKHEVVSFDTVGETTYQAASITYSIKGDKENTRITIPAFATFHRIPNSEEEGGKLKACEVYLDPAPLMRKIQDLMSLT